MRGVGLGQITSGGGEQERSGASCCFSPAPAPSPAQPAWGIPASHGLYPKTGSPLLLLLGSTVRQALQEEWGERMKLWTVALISADSLRGIVLDFFSLT